MSFFFTVVRNAVLFIFILFPLLVEKIKVNSFITFVPALLIFSCPVLQLQNFSCAMQYSCVFTKAS